MRFVLLVLLTLIYSPVLFGSEDLIVVKNTVFQGVLGTSQCSVKVVNDSGAESSLINFGNYHLGRGSGELEKEFTIKVLQFNSAQKGCDAFLVGNTNVNVTFGNQGQMDNLGVITTGAGGNIRIQIFPLDSEASSIDAITSSNDSIYYPAEFVTDGELRFKAKTLGLQNAQAGEYRGAVSVNIIYN
ncbi:hypothetical protein [Shewanella waksmanii]|uniref:hypothetical protein n=1 Tax=Shewanella waksmanii TaxID=213783 RepID=UPI00048CF87E|nr:hypothetical protein [Shewanella waksmanii]